MDNRPTLIVRTRYLPHLLSCLPSYSILLLLAGITTWLYYHDAQSVFRALCCISFILCIHAAADLLQRPTLRFSGAKLFIQRRWGDERELFNLRASDFIFKQTAVASRRNVGSIRVKDMRLPVYAVKGGVGCLHGVEDFDQVCAYVRTHFPA